MRIAILLFDRFTALDAVGPYDVLSHLPGAAVVLVAERPGPVTNEVGSLRLVADAALADVPTADVVVVPGGPGQNAHMTDGPVHQWLRAVDAHSTWTAHEYDPQPPYGSGNPDTAPRAIADAVLARRSSIVS